MSTEAQRHSEPRERRIVGRWVVDGFVGASGQDGYVFSALEQRSAAHPRRVDLTVWDARGWSENERVACLEACEIAQAHPHPALLGTVDYGRVGDVLWRTTEHFDGRTLQEVGLALAGSGRRMSTRLVGALGARIAEGLLFVHDLRGPTGAPLELVYGCLSPDSVMLGGSGFVKLRGLAHRADLPSRDLCGSDNPAFVAPEFATGRPIGVRTDLFGLARVLAWAASGVTATAHTATGQALVLHTAAVPVLVLPDVDRDLALLLEPCLAPDPADRPPNVLWMAGALQQLAATTGSFAGPTQWRTELGALFPDGPDHTGVSLLDEEVPTRAIALLAQLQPSPPAPAAAVSTGRLPFGAAAAVALLVAGVGAGAICSAVVPRNPGPALPEQAAPARADSDPWLDEARREFAQGRFGVARDLLDRAGPAAHHAADIERVQLRYQLERAMRQVEADRFLNLGHLDEADATAAALLLEEPADAAARRILAAVAEARQVPQDTGPPPTQPAQQGRTPGAEPATPVAAPPADPLPAVVVLVEPPLAPDGAAPPARSAVTPAPVAVPEPRPTVAVHPANNVPLLSRAQLRRILLGATARWQNGQGVVLVLPPGGSAELEWICDVVGMPEVAYQRNVADRALRGSIKPPIHAANQTEAAAIVARTPGALTIVTPAGPVAGVRLLTSRTETPE